MTQYYYASTYYNSVDDVEAAVTTLKNQLENNPTVWCNVKPQINIRQMTLVNGNEITVWDDGDSLSDAKIIALTASDDGLFHVYATHDGDNLTDLSAEDTITKIALLRNSYARWLNVDKYYEISDDVNITPIEIAVTNEDMSVFTS